MFTKGHFYLMALSPDNDTSEAREMLKGNCKWKKINWGTSTVYLMYTEVIIITLGIVPNITFYILLLKTKTVVTTPVTTSDMASDSLKSFKRSLKYFCEYFLKIFLPGQFSRFLKQILIFNKAAILAFEAQQSHHLKYQYDIIHRCYIGLNILRKIP